MECPFCAEDLRDYVESSMKAKVAELEAERDEWKADAEEKWQALAAASQRIAELEAQLSTSRGVQDIWACHVHNLEAQLQAIADFQTLVHN